MMTAPSRLATANTAQDSPRSVLFLIRSLDVGGAERQTVTLATELARRGHRVHVAVFYGGGALEHELTNTGVIVTNLEKRGRGDAVAFMRRLVTLLRRLRPDALYTFLDGANVYGAVARRFARSTRLIWGIRSSLLEHRRYGLDHDLLFRASIALSRGADMIVSNSHAGAEYHAGRGYPSKKIRVVPNGIDTDRFTPQPFAGRSLRAKLGIAPNVPLVGLVGRLDPVKDHATFFRAIARLQNRPQPVHAICAGSGPEAFAEQLRQQTEQLGIAPVVHWVKAAESMTALYAALDLLVCSSVGEGFPNAIAEAMACEVPCVVTDVGDSALIVAELGVVVPPRDDQSLADGIARLLAAATPKWRAACRTRIVDNYGVSRLAERTADCLWSAVQ